MRNKPKFVASILIALIITATPNLSAGATTHQLASDPCITATDALGAYAKAMDDAEDDGPAVTAELVRLASIASQACGGESRCIDVDCYEIDYSNPREALPTDQLEIDTLGIERWCTGEGSSIIDMYTLRVFLPLADGGRTIERNLPDFFSQVTWKDLEGSTDRDTGTAVGLNGRMAVLPNSIGEIAYGGIVLSGSGEVNGTCSLFDGMVSITGDSGSISVKSDWDPLAGVVQIALYGNVAGCTGMCQ